MRESHSPQADPDVAGPSHPARISMGTAAALAIADMIGIGVFTSLGFQVKDIPSGFALIMLWLIGGVVALCGALCYAELATAFPRSGGEYNFLSRTYHGALGFLAGWVSATVGFAAPVAVAAMAFGRYAAGVVPDSPPLILAMALIWIVTLVHLRGVSHGATFQNVSTLLKVALIAAFIVAGFAYGTPQPIRFAPAMADLDHILSAPFAISLVFVMYSYSGWNAMTYIAGEVRDPARSLPLSIILAVLVVTLLYTGLNAVFLYTTPIAKLSGQLEVGLIAGREIFGENGARVAGGLICFGLISAVSAMMWIGPRVTMVMGEDLPLLRMLARTSARGAPVTAILLQASIATALLLTQSFELVVNFIQFSLTFCSFLAVLGVIVLRVTQPELPRPYRVWAFPLTPLVFLAVTLFMMIYLVREQPGQSLASLLMMGGGLIVYGIGSVQVGRRSAGKVAKS